MAAIREIDAPKALSDGDALELFRRFICFETVSASGPSSGAYAECVAFLQKQCESLLLPFCEGTVQVMSPVKDKPILLCTLEGTDPRLPAVLLNSHYDVVPADIGRWDVPPFEAVVKDGKLYGRGTQDMKCVCIQYIAALHRLLSGGWRPRRALVLSFVPDEEIGGADGMCKLLGTDTFKSLNVGVALDEGIAHTEDAYTVFFGERTPWWILVTAAGNTGHGSRFIDNTAMPKLMTMAQKALAYRGLQEKLLGFQGGCSHCNAKKLGDVVTVNLTMLNGGVSADGGKTYSLNVIPTTATAGFDIRVPPNVSAEEMKKVIDTWCEEGDGSVSWKFAPWTEPLMDHYTTQVDDSNPYWVRFKEAFSEDNLGYKVDLQTEVFPAATDSRFIRKLGIPAFGFSPLRRCPILLHEHNEYIPIEIFYEGISVYEKLIPSLADMPATE